MAKKSVKQAQQDRQTILSILAFVVIILLLLTVFQLGIVGEYIDAFFAYLIGSTRYLLYVLITVFIIMLASNQKMVFTKRVFGFILIQISLIFIMHSILYMIDKPRVDNFYDFQDVVNYIQTYGIMHFFGGGIIGQFIFMYSSTTLSLIGTILIGLICWYFGVLMALKRDVGESLREHGNYIAMVTTKISVFLWTITKRVSVFVSERFSLLFDKEKGIEDEVVPDTSSENLEKTTEPKAQAKFKLRSDKSTGSNVPEPVIEDDLANRRPKRQIEIESSVEDTFVQETHVEDEKIDEGSEEVPREITYENEDFEEDINTLDEVEEKLEFQTFTDEEYDKLSRYSLPSITMLKDAEITEKMSNEEVLKLGEVLEETLENFGVNATVSKIRIGPAVTQFEVQPDIGVKVSKIINLQNDIALNLAAKDIRIEAPIPGKSAVGIEVPNSVISMVTLREVLKKRTSDNPLDVALGKDISGAPITAELNKMPHLLVAGSTGSGKSVCINGIIISILMNAKPHEVKLMMVDPKMVELNIYNGIPHLLSPVVTNPQKASDALNKIVSEMERRYDLFSHTNTRNIEAYNQFLERESGGEKKVQKLPYIVVIIDELADLMMVASKDVEASITRIAQMARAAGIHLIIATQRPSVDVITGIIKANIPSRIAFSVSSQTDSRTIIDSGGAEKLLGRGDMLFLPSGRSKPIRVQGAFLSDEEVSDVVKFITDQMKANYENSVLHQPVQTTTVESEDDLYPDAKWFVIEEQRASASLLQRQFRIGYNRAARLIDDLEANGVIGPSSGSKPRNVLIDNNE